MSIAITLTESTGKEEKKFAFTKPGKLIIGRLEDCSIPILEPTVSRQHALLEISPPSILIRDLGSLNGTFVNGKSIGERGECEVGFGDKLGIGPDCELNVRVTFIRDQKREDDPALDLTSFNIINLLGKGKLGEVWRVVSTDNNEYALRLMPPQLTASDVTHKIMKRGTKALVKMNHENVLRAYCTGIVNDMYYLLMELCDCGTVEQLIQKSGGRLSVDLTMNIILQALDGVIYAHDSGVIHRSLKPSNIFLSGSLREPAVKIADFGLDNDNTGSLVFMPRRQIIDYWCQNPDTWAIAACFYFMLTGYYPRDTSGEDAAWIAREEKAVPILQRDSRIRIPNRLAEVIDNALDEEQEPPTVLQFREQIMGAW